MIRDLDILERRIQARLYHMAADCVSTRAPHPPKGLVTTGRLGHGGSDKHTGRGQAMTISRKRSVFAPKRQRSWS